MIEFFGLLTCGLAITGVVLNNRLNIICFWFWMMSNALSATLHLHVELWSLFLRDVVFFVLCIEGYLRWRRDARKSTQQDK